MQRVRWSRPSCIVMLILFAVALAALAWLVSGSALKTPNPASVTRETPAYDTDVPAKPADDR